MASIPNPPPSSSQLEDTTTPQPPPPKFQKLNEASELEKRGDGSSGSGLEKQASTQAPVGGIEMRMRQLRWSKRKGCGRDESGDLFTKFVLRKRNKV